MKKMNIGLLVTFLVCIAGISQAQPKNKNFPDPKITDSKATYPMKLSQNGNSDLHHPNTIFYDSRGLKEPLAGNMITSMKKEPIILRLRSNRFLVPKQSSTPVRAGPVFMRRSIPMRSGWLTTKAMAWSVGK
jgi:hypothetical protein